MGVILSGRNPFAVDVACAELISMKPEEIYMLRSAMERGLSPRSAGELEVLGESLETYIQKDFVQPESKTSNFIEKLPRFLRPLATRLASPAPKIRKEECVGCGKCAEIGGSQLHLQHHAGQEPLGRFDIDADFEERQIRLTAFTDHFEVREVGRSGHGKHGPAHILA